MLKTDAVGNLTEAGKHLLSAASVLQYIHDAQAMFSVCRQRPLESYISLALALLFKGNAQALAVQKALTNEAASASFKARLCVSVVESLTQSYDSLHYARFNMLMDSYHLQMLDALLIQTGIKRDFFLAIVYLFVAQSHSERNEVGIATAFCRAAKVSRHLLHSLVIHDDFMNP